MKPINCIILSFILLFNSCKTSEIEADSSTKSNEKQILSFSFEELNPVVKATINQTTFEITAEVPSSVNLKALKPTLTISNKASVSPITGTSQDFTNTIKYTVKAEDGTLQIYNVTIVNTPSSVSDAMYFISTTNPISVPSTNKMICLDPKNGSKKWETLLNIESYYSIAYPLMINNFLYVIAKHKDNGSVFYKINPSNGKIVLEVRLNIDLSIVNPLTDGKSLFIYNLTMLTAIDLNTGNKSWQYATNLGWNPNDAGAFISDVIYISGLEKMLAVDNNGTKKWEFTDNTPLGTVDYPYFYNGATLANNLVLFENTRKLYALDSKTGVKKWENLFFSGDRTNLSVSVHNITTENNIVYLMSVNNGLWAFNIDDGKKLFNYQIESPSSNFLVKNNIMFYTDFQGVFIARDLKNNSIIWKSKEIIERSTSEIRNTSSPIIFDGLLYVRDLKGYYAFNPNTGNLVWKYSSTEIVGPNIIVSKDGKVNYTTDSGMMQ